MDGDTTKGGHIVNKKDIHDFSWGYIEFELQLF